MALCLQPISVLRENITDNTANSLLCQDKVRVNSLVCSFHCYQNRKCEGSLASTLKKLKTCCTFFFLIKQNSKKEVYLIMKK